MKNVATTLKGTILTIEVDLSKTFGPSSTGKTTIIASTEGNMAVDAPSGLHGGKEIKLGLNVYAK